ncbi:MAG: heme biosynthesis protein HemY [Polaromonas sp.]|jgi:HemY protein|nr:heme biosynthesis protein HemY [Polaromonas sp.]
MRAALWFVALFGVAVAVALLAGHNHAVVTLFWPPYRVDLSFNLMLLVLVAAFALFHFALKALSVVASLPRQARRWRAQQKERAMYAALMDALAHLLAGRFIRASRSAENALLQEKNMSELIVDVGTDSGHQPARSQQLRSLAHLLAAESAQALQNRGVRDVHLQQALEGDGNRTVLETQEGIQLRAARWALEDREPGLAMEWLNKLPLGAGRRTLALRMRLRAARLAGHTSDALETARLLAKHRAFSPLAAQSIIRGLALELLNAAHDPEQLNHVWLSLDDVERAMPELAVHAASRLMVLKGDAAVARHWLAGAWDVVMKPHSELGDKLRVTFILTLEDSLDGIDAVWLARIEAALQARPGDANFEYLAGVACLKRQLWGKAQQLLSHAVLSLQDVVLKRKAWLALAGLAEQRGEEDAVQKAYRHAAEA